MRIAQRERQLYNPGLSPYDCYWLLRQWRNRSTKDKMIHSCLILDKCVARLQLALRKEYYDARNN